MPATKRQPVPLVLPRKHVPVRVEPTVAHEPLWSVPAFKVSARVLAHLDGNARGLAEEWYRERCEPTRLFADGGKYAPLTDAEAVALLEVLVHMVTAAENGLGSNPRADLTAARACERKLRALIDSH